MTRFVYVRNLEELSKNFLELIRSYSKFARYKIHIQKLLIFLYVSIVQVEFEIKKTTEFHFISTPKNKILSCKSNKICTNLYEENFKTLMKEIK